MKHNDSSILELMKKAVDGMPLPALGTIPDGVTNAGLDR
jgi:hypothetical protein